MENIRKTLSRKGHSYILCFIIVAQFICFPKLSAQPHINEIVPLSIGANIPDQIWDMQINVMNNPDGKNAITLREYKGKLILLDFWGTYCSSCIGGFPHLIDIQKKNNDKIEILAVSNEGREKLEKFFTTGGGRDRKIHTTAEERTLAKYFPHSSVPHTIWISPDGKYLNPSNSYEVTQENIDSILQNKKTNIRIKFNVDPKKPLMISDNFFVNDNLALGFYTLFFNGYCPSYGSGGNFKRDDQGKVYGRQFTNQKLSAIVNELGNKLFEESGENFTPRRAILNSTNPLLIDSDPRISEQLRNDQYFSYELIVPKQYSDSLYFYMLADLNRYLNVSLKLKKVQTNCLVLLRTSQQDKIKSKGNSAEFNYSEKEETLRISNIPIAKLISVLNDVPNSPLPIIDETGVKENIDIVLKGINNLKDLKESLKNYDLNIIQQERELLMYIIDDKH